MDIIRYPLDIARYPHTEFQIIKFRERNFQIDENRQLTNISPERELLNTIVLPLPENINNNYNLDWEMADTRAIKFLEQTLQNDSALQAGIDPKTQQNAQAIVLGTFSKIFSQKTHNPKKQALFNGISPRTFSFDFTFAPHSLEEVQRLEKVIKTLTQAALPTTFGQALKQGFEESGGDPEFIADVSGQSAFEIRENVDDANSAFFGFPDEFEITFKDVRGFPKLSPCVCTNISTNYTPQAVQLFETGHSIQINLSLQFLETELLRRTKPGI